MSNGPATRLGMVRCEHCQRQFNQHSAARHIPWCKKQNETRKRHLTADKLEALERYRWRIGYKPSNLISNHSRTFAKGNANNCNSQRQRQQTGQQTRAAPNGEKNFRVDEEVFQGDEFSGDENSENDDEYGSQQQSRASMATTAGRQISHSERRAQNGSNSSATFSSPSAGSITSLNNSLASTLSRPNHARTNANPTKQQQQQQHQRAANRTMQDGGKLVRSVSSVTINKHAHGPGSASSRNSRVSAATIGAPDELHTLRTSKGRPQAGQAIGAEPRRIDQMRARSVSDLSSMGEIVETLAKRMEEIYAQNQLLLDSIIRSKLACDNEAAIDKPNREIQRDGIETDDWSEFAQCHHCRARCLVEANYCHKCGCKMRPSNPTPSTPE